MGARMHRTEIIGSVIIGDHKAEGRTVAAHIGSRARFRLWTASPRYRGELEGRHVPGVDESQQVVRLLARLGA
jgi:hypothetical protein